VLVVNETEVMRVRADRKPDVVYTSDNYALYWKCHAEVFRSISATVLMVLELISVSELLIIIIFTIKIVMRDEVGMEVRL
jgi:hypothetical protein